MFLTNSVLFRSDFVGLNFVNKHKMEDKLSKLDTQKIECQGRAGAYGLATGTLVFCGLYFFMKGIDFSVNKVEIYQK